MYTSGVFAQSPSLTDAVNIATDGLENVSSSGEVLNASCNPQNQNLCPQKLLEDLRSNRGRGRHWLANMLGVRTANETCNISESMPNFTGSTFQNERSLEEALSQNSRFSLGMESGALSSCLDGPGMNYGPEERKAFISSYYYEKNRLNQGGLATLEAIARYNALLGEDQAFWNSPDCADPLIQGAREFCEAQKSCRNERNNTEMVQTTRRTLAVLPTYLAIENDLKNIRLADSRGRPIAAQAQRKEALEKLLAMVQEQMPWLKEGTTFRKEYKTLNDLNPQTDLGNVSISLRKQITEDRDAMMNQWGKVRDAHSCLNTNSTSSRENNPCEDYDTTLRSLPEFLPELPESPNRNDLSLKYEVETARCLSEGRGIIDDGARIINGFAFDVGVTIATLGAGAIVNGVRAGAVAATGGARIGRVGTAITNQLSRLSNAQKMRLYGTALAGGTSLEMYMAYDDFKVATDECLNQEASLPQNVSPRSLNSQMCIAADIEQMAIQRKENGFNLQDCMLSAGVAALNLVPVMGPALGRLEALRRSTRSGAVELVDDTADLSGVRQAPGNVRIDQSTRAPRRQRTSPEIVVTDPDLTRPELPAPSSATAVEPSDLSRRLTSGTRNGTEEIVEEAAVISDVRRADEMTTTSTSLAIVPVNSSLTLPVHADEGFESVRLALREGRIPDDPFVSFELNNRRISGEIVEINPRTGDVTIRRLDGSRVTVRGNALKKVRRSPHARRVFSNLPNLLRAGRDIALSDEETPSDEINPGRTAESGAQDDDSSDDSQTTVTTDTVQARTGAGSATVTKPNVSPGLVPAGSDPRGAADTAAKGIR